MFEFTDAERESLIRDRGLSKDEQGREVLVGLTAAETELLISHRRKRSLGDRDTENRTVCMELTEKHERARLEVIGTEHHLRTNNPTRQ